MFSPQGAFLALGTVYVVYLVIRDIRQNGLWGEYGDTKEWK